MISCPDSHSARSGISIIEVLTSIVVAMIGVFGVMILIPFAVKQAKTGLDSDAATVVARNAYAQFEIAGYRNTNTWIVDAAPTAADPTMPQMYSIDPLAITENGGNYAGTTFPYRRTPVNGNAINVYPAGASPMPNYVINAVNLGTPNGTAMVRAGARRMFRAADDLVFGESIDSIVGNDAEFNGPMQIFDSNGATPLRRQSIGAISWSAIVVPVKDEFVASTNVDAWKYRMYVLVYKDRVTALTETEKPMITAKLDETDNSGLASPLSTVYLEDTSVTFDPANFRKDDWVMLINQDTSKQEGFQHQLAFCRVVSFSDGDNGMIKPAITLDGPDFDFGTGGTVEPTHIVHLKDVIGVYERTFTPEGSSNWNFIN